MAQSEQGKLALYEKLHKQNQIKLKKVPTWRLPFVFPVRLELAPVPEIPESHFAAHHSLVYTSISSIVIVAVCTKRSYG